MASSIPPVFSSRVLFDPVTVEIMHLLQNCEETAHKGDWNRSISSINKLLPQSQEPLKSLLNYQLGRLYYYQGLLETALSTLSLINQFRYTIEIYLLKSSILLALNDKEKALLEVTSAEKLLHCFKANPKFKIHEALINFHRAIVYYALKRPLEAIGLLLFNIENIHPLAGIKVAQENFYRSKILLARIYFEQLKPFEALKLVEGFHDPSKTDLCQYTRVVMEYYCLCIQYGIQDTPLSNAKAGLQIASEIGALGEARYFESMVNKLSPPHESTELKESNGP